MKVLAIMGSPRKNSDSLKVTRQVEERMHELGEVTFDYLMLRDAHMEPCRGCFTCTTRGEELCPLKDDREAIERRMLDSDGVIFVSPAYVHNVSALMKNFFDRFNYVCHRPRFFDQKAMLISTGGGPWATKDCLARLDTLVFGGGFHRVHKLSIIGRPLSRIQRPHVKEKEEQEIHTAAEKFFAALKTKLRPAPNLQQLMVFRGMRVSTSSAKACFPRDNEYWEEKGWLDRRTKYFYEARINPMKNLFAVFLERWIGRKLRKDYVIDD